MSLNHDDLLKSKSLIVEVADNFFESDALEDKLSKLKEMTDLEVFDLAYQFDRSLEAQRLNSPLIEGCVVPLLYSRLDFANSERINSPDFQSHERLTLINDQVAVPLGDMEDMTFDLANTRRRKKDVLREAMARFLTWIEENRSFIERGIVVPYPVDIYETAIVDRMTFQMAERAPIPRTIKRPSQVAPVIDNMSRIEFNEHVRMGLFALFDQLFISKAMGAVPVSVHPYMTTLWEGLLAEGARSKWMIENDSGISRTLMKLKLPKLEEVSHADIIALRNNSEAFAIWRERIHSVMLNVASKVEGGADPDRAMLKEELPLKEAARNIQKEIKGGAIGKKLKNMQQNILVGLAMLTVSNQVMQVLRVQPSAMRDIIRLGSTALGPFLSWLLFERPGKGQKSALKIYQGFGS